MKKRNEKMGVALKSSHDIDPGRDFPVTCRKGSSLAWTICQARKVFTSNEGIFTFRFN